MNKIVLGNENASICLIQAVDEHDASFLTSEYEIITDLSGRTDILLVALQVSDWNHDLSPWKAPAVFGKEDFGDGAEKTLSYIEEELLPDIHKKYDRGTEGIPCIIGGYSMSGLFALWASCQSSAFCACAAASPSVWFPGWMDYVEANMPKAKHVYLSLGDKEEKTKNPVMRTVADCIRTQHNLLRDSGINSILEWNPGNHFRDADLRMAKAFAWCIRQPCNGIAVDPEYQKPVSNMQQAEKFLKADDFSFPKARVK